MTSAHRLYGPGLDGEPMDPLRLDPAREPAAVIQAAKQQRGRDVRRFVGRVRQSLFALVRPRSVRRKRRAF